MGRKYFGTDGVRGRVGEAPITPDFVLRLGYAAGRVLAQQRGSGRPAVLIGKDTRVSGYMLEAALEAGFSAAGVDVLLTGPLPTPGVAYLTRALRLSAGVVISASHNPYDDNGIKFFSGDGNKLADAVEEQIETELEAPIGCVVSDQLGRARRVEDAAGRYIEFCKSSFPSSLDLHGMRLVVDCAHGAAYHTAPHVFHELGAEVFRIGAEPNGLNINLEVGASHPHSLRSAVLEHRADLGIAVDGDADRVLVIDAEGRAYNGDELLYVIVRDRLNEAPVAGVVGTLMTNLALEQAFAASGVGFARAKVGDRYVLETLHERGWLFGGESSGHLLCLDCHSTGDGTISALQVLRAIRGSGRTLAELTAELSLFPQTLINVRVARGFDWCGDERLRKARGEVEAELGDDGRVLIRPSGTEPLLRLMVEARDDGTARRLAQRLADAVTA
ncbi:MAG: phosphoglucosamine mutase [Burkholderiaceae bacterium]|nr:phosphoglucosamine mutase [Burkholderiaceae bacterium]